MSSRLGKTTVVHFLTQIGTTLAGFLATWYINWELGPGAYGSYSAALALLFWLNVPASAIGNSMTKRVSEGTDKGGFVATGFLVNGLIHAVIVVVLITFGRQVNVFVGEDVALFLAALVAARALFDSTLYALRGNKQVDTSGVVKAGEQVVRSAIHIGGLFFVGFGVGGLVAGYAAASFLATGAGLAVLTVRPTRPTWDHVETLFEFAKFAWLGILKNKAFAWADVAMMRGLSLSVVGLATVSKVQIGIYTVSWTVASVLALLSISINKTLFPEISELGTHDDYDEIHHLVEEGLTFTGVLVIPGLVGAWFVGGKLLTVFGEEYIAGGTILVILIGARLFAAYGDYLTNTINAIDRPDVAFRVNFAYVVANVSLNLVLITLFGWYGAAFATASSALFSIAVAGYALSGLIGRPEVPVREIGLQIVASGVMAAVIFALQAVVANTLAWAIVLVGVGAFVYGVAIVGLSNRVRTKVFAFLPT